MIDTDEKKSKITGMWVGGSMNEVKTHVLECLQQFSNDVDGDPGATGCVASSSSVSQEMNFCEGSVDHLITKTGREFELDEVSWVEIEQMVRTLFRISVISEATIEQGFTAHSVLAPTQTST